MNVKKLGSDFEKELCRYLFNNGFWVYNTVNKSSGQPMDIIACVDNMAILIDAKVCINDRFATSRIEENQKNSAFLFERCGNDFSYFAFKFSDGSVYLLELQTLLLLSTHYKTLKKKEITQYAWSLPEWIARMKKYDSSYYE